MMTRTPYGTTLHKESVKVLLVLLLYSFILMFFLSPDSYLYDLYYHADSSIFFMCGKAWMCGMMPYVDFADSKGPLLWFIYGIGYLLSHHSMVGVFWLSIPFLTVTLYVAYKLCLLFVDRDVAVISTAVLPLFLFWYVLHMEVKSEDFCDPFVMISLYCMCKILKERDSDRKTYVRLSGVMGVCCMCCMLIKYNVACMVMGLMAVVFYKAIKHGAGRDSFLAMAVGFVIPAIPFVLCFLIYGNMVAFIQEYFINTLKTIVYKNGIKIDAWQIGLIKLVVGTVVVLTAGLTIFCKRYKTGYWLIPCFLLFVIGLGRPYSRYYYTILMPFFIFLIMAFVDFVLRKLPQLRRYAVALSILLAVISICYNTSFIDEWEFEESAKDDYYRTSYVMAQVEHPKVLFEGLEFGTGIPAVTLPGTKYWINQWGATQQMGIERAEALRAGKYDFYCTGYPTDEVVKALESYGYVFYCNTPRCRANNEPQHLAVFGRPGLKLPPEDFQVSQWDIWLKRNIFGK